jgi:serine protease inhibitor
MNDKYKMFKNFMHNELDISKIDIKEWIKEAVHEEIKNLVNKTYESFSMKEVIRETVHKELFKDSYWRDELKPKIREEAVKELTKNIKLVVK